MPAKVWEQEKDSEGHFSHRWNPELKGWQDWSIGEEAGEVGRVQIMKIPGKELELHLDGHGEPTTEGF